MRALRVGTLFHLTLVNALWASSRIEPLRRFIALASLSLFLFSVSGCAKDASTKSKGSKPTAGSNSETPSSEEPQDDSHALASPNFVLQSYGLGATPQSFAAGSTNYTLQGGIHDVGW